MAKIGLETLNAFCRNLQKKGVSDFWVFIQVIKMHSNGQIMIVQKFKDYLKVKEKY